MLIAHAGLVGLALEGGLVVVPLVLFLVFRKRFKVNKVGGSGPPKPAEEASGTPSGNA